MNQFLNIISDIRVVIGIAVLVVVLAVWLIVEKVRTKKARRELEELEKRYMSLKSVPLSLKMNKAVAVSKVNQETAAKMNEANIMFDQIQNSVTNISNLLAETEDNILVGKLRKADGGMSELERELSLSEREVKELDAMLEDILSRETEQRQEVTTLKNRFRALKAEAQEKATALAFCWEAVEQRITKTEKSFSTFEEWMFSSDYDKANTQLGVIQSDMAELEEILATMPGLLEETRGYIPSMVETIVREYTRNRNRGVYLKHLDFEKNLQLIKTELTEDLKVLKNAKFIGVADHIDLYKARLTQLDEAVRKEAQAYDEMKSLSKETEELSVTTNENAGYVEKSFSQASVHFGLESLDETLDTNLAELKRLNDMTPRVIDNVRNYQIPASTVMVSLRELNQDLTRVNEALSEMRSRMESASSDEDRARKQLVKLQIIMNQMQVKIRKYKLPNISKTYEEDMRKANSYIQSIETLISESPMNMQLLNATLREALDFIYTLYNNVNNVVGTVVMVENTIVFGNRYRSTYADIDSELTRSELSFRNGEYTQALTTAIATVEKIHPGNYESMIKENAKGAE